MVSGVLTLGSSPSISAASNGAASTDSTVATTNTDVAMVSSLRMNA
ncbi:Uncharacterised protein [Mycobacteroides abscessus subsp. massiliense]|nr:Uncharacterised protein [Mycobacteroides abscessus subsp. massiliense]